MEEAAEEAEEGEGRLLPSAPRLALDCALSPPPPCAPASLAAALSVAAGPLPLALSAVAPTTSTDDGMSRARLCQVGARRRTSKWNPAHREKKNNNMIVKRRAQGTCLGRARAVAVVPCAWRDHTHVLSRRFTRK